MNKFLVLMTLLSLAACGGGDSEGNGGNDNNVVSNSQKFDYQFIFNGCDTGRHKLGSLSALCDRLESQSQNNNCAIDRRESYFKENGCPGRFSPSK